MKAHLLYLWYVLRHKWYVFVECCRLGIPWLGIIHDLSKFSRAEFQHYGRQFFGDKNNPSGFAVAWLHHQNCNPHHWQYWLYLDYSPVKRWTIQQYSMENPMILTLGGKHILTVYAADDDAIHTKAFHALDDIVKQLNAALYHPLPMPDKYRREMLADWRGAGKAITGEDNTAAWYVENKDKMQLHPETRKWIEAQL